MDLRGGFPSALSTLKGKTVLGMTCCNMGSIYGTQDDKWAHMRTLGQGCPFTLFFLQGLSILTPYSYWAKGEEDKTTILLNAQYPTMMLQQKRACPGTERRTGTESGPSVSLQRNDIQ